MKRSLHSSEAGEVAKRVAQMRKAAGLTQRQLAEALGVFRSEVAKMETRERRVDVVQLYILCRALRLDPAKVAAQMFRAFDGMRRSHSKT